MTSYRPRFISSKMKTKMVRVARAERQLGIILSWVARLFDQECSPLRHQKIRMIVVVEIHTLLTASRECGLEAAKWPGRNSPSHLLVVNSFGNPFFSLQMFGQTNIQLFTGPSLVEVNPKIGSTCLAIRPNKGKCIFSNKQWILGHVLFYLLNEINYFVLLISLEFTSTSWNRGSGEAGKRFQELGPRGIKERVYCPGTRQLK